MRRSHEIDMTSGALMPQILLFALPLMFTNILQLLFNAADSVIAGKFAGSLSLAAVGSTGSLITLLVSTFSGISAGVNVLAANLFGARKHEELSRCVHSAVSFSAVLGIGVALFGYFFSGSILRLTNPDPEVFPLATLYLKIYFIGAPATLVYNFGAAVLRAIGDTDRPMRFLLVSGVVNVLLNLFTVIVLDMSVAGVAIATVASQYISAFLVIHCLFVSEGSYTLQWRRMRMHKDMVGQILKLGLPNGISSGLFCLSNVIVQSSMNTFGAATIAGNAACSNIDSFVYISVSAFSQAAISFTSQNMGAKRYDRLNKVILSCVALSFTFSVILTALAYGFGPQLLSLFVSKTDPNRQKIIEVGMIRMTYVCLPYFIQGISNVSGSMLTGMGKPWISTIVAIFINCVFRLFWMTYIFPLNPTLVMIHILYPISWFMTGLLNYTFLFFVKRKLKRSLPTALQP